MNRNFINQEIRRYTNIRDIVDIINNTNSEENFVEILINAIEVKIADNEEKSRNHASETIIAQRTDILKKIKNKLEDVKALLLFK